MAGMIFLCNFSKLHILTEQAWNMIDFVVSISAFQSFLPYVYHIHILWTKSWSCPIEIWIPWYNWPWKCSHQLYLHDQVGAHAVYMWRHRRFFGNSRESLEHIGRVVVLNMVLLHFFLFISFRLCFKNILCSICNIFFHRVWASSQGESITGAM